MKSGLIVAFFKIIKFYNIKINKKWGNFKMLFKSEIEISEFISEVSLINLETGNIKVCSVLNASSVIFLMEIIYFNKNRIS